MLPLVLLAGCTNTQTQPSKPMSAFKCTLPSQPGVISAEVTDFPSEILASSEEETPIIFSVEFENTITGVDDDKIELKYTFIPNIGKKFDNTISMYLAYYDPTSGQITPYVTFEQIETEIPAGISEIGVYKGLLKWEFKGKTKVYIPICIGLDPKKTKVSPEAMVCDPTDLPEPCYSASPVIVNVESVKAMGFIRESKGGIKEIKGHYIIKFSLKDVYGGLGKCYEDLLSNIRKVKVNKIELKVDDLSIELDDKDIFKCPSIKGEGTNRYVYLGRSNEIICHIDLNMLMEECKRSGQCYLDVNSLKLGKSAMISIELEYDYCRSITLGPAKIITLS